MTEQKEPHLLSGAYALNALGPQERAEYEKFLEQSEEARTEVAGMSDTAVLLGLASPPVAPSPQLKANLMELISRTPQLPADDVPAQSSGAEAEQPTARPAERVEQPTEQSAQRIEPPQQAPARPSGAVRTITPAADEQGAQAQPEQLAPTTRAESTAERRWFQRRVGAMLAAAAAAALVVGGIGGTLIGLSLNSEQREIADLATAEDLRQAVQPVEGGGTATLIWSDDLGRSAILVDDLPELSADETYQLWYIDDQGATPAGTFQTTASGTTMRLLEGSRQADDLVGVTVEPAGGSEAPTSDPIVVIDA